MIEINEDLRIKQIENGFIIESNFGIKYIENINDLTKAITIFYSQIEN